MGDESKSVLVVEDDRAINALISAYVEFCGMSSKQAFDGMSAVESAKTSSPRAVILDLMLPDIDGFEVCRRLRADASTAHTPIIILSALGGEADRQRGQDCGATAHLVKPFNPDQFIQVLKSHANGSPQA